MPALSVSIDGKAIATVCTDGYDVLDVRVSGTRVDEELACLDVSGGSYPQEGESTYLIWVCELPLRPSQLVTISFLESGSSSHKGKTVAEMFPDEEPTTITDFTPTPKMINELQAKPRLREKFSFRLNSSLGTAYVGETEPDEHGFGMSLLWNSSQPERAKVSLHSFSLESLAAHGPLNKHVEEHMHFGGSVRFELVA